MTVESVEEVLRELK
ncbi:TPA: hypothetical protein ACWZRV_001903 [Streptococcus agalactiae]